MSNAPRIDRLERNCAINGALDFWQRVGGNTTTSSGTGSAFGYTADRILYSMDTTSSRSVSIVRSTNVPTSAQAGFTPNYSYQVTNTNAISLAASNSVVPFIYSMEGYDYAKFHGGRTIKIGFWFQSSIAGDYPFAMKNGTNNRSYVTKFNYASANVWQFIEIEITTDAIGTWSVNSSLGAAFYLGWSGSTYSTSTTGSWQNGNLFSTSGVVDFVGTAGAVMRITMFSITEGGMGAGTFRRAGNTIAEELMFCQRYYEKSYSVDTVPGTAGASPGILRTVATNSSYLHQNCIIFKVTKRTSPSVTFNSPADGQAGTARDATAASNRGVDPAYPNENSVIVYSGSAAFTLGNEYQVHWKADAEF